MQNNKSLDNIDKGQYIFGNSLHISKRRGR